MNSPLEQNLNPYQRTGQGCVRCFHTFLPGEPGEPFARFVVNGQVVALARACPECRDSIAVPDDWERLDGTP